MDLIQSIWGWFLAQGLFIQIIIGLGVLAGLTTAVILIGIGYLFSVQRVSHQVAHWTE